MIQTTNMLLEGLKEYANPKTKLSRMVKRGECFQIIKGLYETNKSTPAYLLAGSIYGPSYISFEYALSFYGMIPEAVYTVTSATFEKKKKKSYKTDFGTFTYRDTASEAFPFAIRLLKDGEYYYRIAEPEKALCDQVYISPPTQNFNELALLIFDNLRIEESELYKLNSEKTIFLSQYYHSTNVKRLAAFLRRLNK